MVVVDTYSPFGVKKTCPYYLPHSIINAMSSSLGELFVFNFCLHDPLYITPLPKVKYMPLWLCMSECKLYKLSTHQLGCSPGSIVEILRTPQVLHHMGKFLVMICVRAFTHVHRKATAVCISCLVCLHRYNNFASMWWCRSLW